MSQNVNPGAPQPSGQQPGGRPGQMTAVMRAMAQATGPKVLRIGLVTAGRIIEERVIKQRTTVTVGPSEKAMFVVQAPGLPAQFKLFELVGADYYLNFLDNMTGRVALATGITDIVALKGQAKRVGNVYQVRLTEEARGKVILGDTTFLFQFVAPPPPQPRPQLPLAVKGGLASQIDWNLTVIAAFSFMLHFGLIGAMYSDWMDPVLNEDAGLTSLMNLQANLPPPPVEDKVVEEKGKEEKKEEKKAVAATKAEKAAPSGERPKVSEAKAAALSSAVDALNLGLLGTRGGAGPAVAGVLSNAADIPMADLTRNATNGSAVSTGDLRGVGGAGGPVQPGKGGAGLGGIAGGTGAQAGTGTGTAAVVAGPKGDATLGPVSAGGSVTGAEQCIAKLRPRFKSCYNKGLSTDPTMSGKVVIQAKVGPNGDVSGTEVVSNSGLSSDVVECIRAAIKRADCMAAGPSGGSVGIPVSFVQQK